MGVEEYAAQEIDRVIAVFDLTATERTVLALACQGLGPTEISKARGVATSTTKKQAHAICDVLGVSSLAHAATVVLRMALVDALSSHRQIVAA